uniref:Uncharacterized protein n=1 Tax=Lygus hesperus TaxID=30085 RepID=A0A0A9Z530_LYGHE
MKNYGDLYGNASALSAPVSVAQMNELLLQQQLRLVSSVPQQQNTSFASSATPSLALPVSSLVSTEQTSFRDTNAHPFSVASMSTMNNTSSSLMKTSQSESTTDSKSYHPSHLLFSSNTNNIVKAMEQNKADQGMLSRANNTLANMSSLFSTNPLLNQSSALLYQHQHHSSQQ